MIGLRRSSVMKNSGSVIQPAAGATHDSRRRLPQYLARVVLLALVAVAAVSAALATQAAPVTQERGVHSGNPPVPTGIPSTVPTVPPPLMTATPCVVVFTDVPSSSPFYSYIRCLVCHQVVSGYQCGGPNEPCPGLYFRPGANITRGQLAKLVANSAGFGETVTTQTFQDVPPGSTFYQWVERLA